MQAEQVLEAGLLPRLQQGRMARLVKVGSLQGEQVAQGGCLLWKDRVWWGKAGAKT